MDAVSRMLQFLSQNDIVAIDIETTGLNTRRDSIIGFGVSSATEGVYLPLKFWDGTSLQDAGVPSASIQMLLMQLATKKLLTFNGSLDLPFLKNAFGIDLVPSLHADVLLLKHTCDEEFPFGLKEIATKIFGHDATKEKQKLQAAVKAAGGHGHEYFKALTETLAKYCIQDCLLTFRLFNYYSKELQRQGLEDFYYNAEVLPLYKNVTIPMEQKGVGLDIPKLKKAQAEIAQDIFDLHENIQEAIRPHLGLFTTWFLNKDYPVSRGGSFAQMVCEYYNLTLPRTASGAFSLSEKALSGLPDSVAKNFLQGKAKLPEAVVAKIQQRLWQKDSDGHMFNLQSKHHLKKLFFDTLKEKPLSTTSTGQPQVDEDFLELAATKYDWAKQLIVYNKLCKLKSTYIDRFIEEAEDGIFYPSFMQHRTVSGRYGSDLQQLPRPLEDGHAPALVVKYTNLVREFIIPLQDCVLISADYEQLEPSVFAHNSGDSSLIAIFNSGLDFYSEVAIRTEGLEGVSSDKAAPNYLGKINKSKRQKAKSYALGIAYGMTAYKLKFELNCDEYEAEQLVKDYYAAFPQLKKTMDALQEDAKTKGRVISQAGRVRRMPDAKRLFDKYGHCISNGLELWKQFHEMPSVYAKAKEDARTFKNLINNALNFPIQSLAASIVNRACIAINAEFASQGLNAYICMQVHDEIVVMAHKDCREQVIQIMQRVMQTIMPLKVPLRAEPVCGLNFKQCK